MTEVLALVRDEMVAGGEMSAARARSNVASKLENRTLLLSDRRRRGSASTPLRVGKKRARDGGVAPALSQRKFKKALGRTENSMQPSGFAPGDGGGDGGDGGGAFDAPGTGLGGTTLAQAEVLAAAWEAYFEEACHDALGRAKHLSATERVRRKLAAADLHGARLTIVQPGPNNATRRRSDGEMDPQSESRGLSSSSRRRRRRRRGQRGMEAGDPPPVVAGMSGIIIGDSANVWTIVCTGGGHASAEGQVVRAFKAGGVFSILVRRASRPQKVRVVAVSGLSSSDAPSSPLSAAPASYDAFTLLGDHWMGRLPGDASSGSWGGGNILAQFSNTGSSGGGTPATVTSCGSGQQHWQTASEAAAEYAVVAGTGSSAGSGINRRQTRKERERLLTTKPYSMI
jgi:hypothetical protein